MLPVVQGYKNDGLYTEHGSIFLYNNAESLPETKIKSIVGMQFYWPDSLLRI